jgi:hypothetical protein
MVTDIKLLQPIKASFPIESTDEGMLTEDKLEQLEKA